METVTGRPSLGNRLNDGGRNATQVPENPTEVRSALERLDGQIKRRADQHGEMRERLEALEARLGPVLSEPKKQDPSPDRPPNPSQEEIREKVMGAPECVVSKEIMFRSVMIQHQTDEMEGWFNRLQGLMDRLGV